MDEYDSQRPWGRHRHTEDVTPIYDRLLAEWQAAQRDQEPKRRPDPGPPRASGLVPAARTSEESFGD
ncbi:hypothetical protein ACFVXE_35795 [Streptomyces sp. NPDC058231]|uniref:hypothetical protein n=1 Tax=unclassified Streptomyces TaxID=2593676 RepID=UPI0036E1E38A